MLDMTIEGKIVAHLREKYHPVGIILHGSRASGKARPGSDWDIVVLIDGASECTSPDTQEFFEEEALDVDTVTVPSSDKEILQAFANQLMQCKILYDTNDSALSIVQRSRELAAQGKKLTQAEYNSRKSFLYRLVRRLESFEDAPGPFFYHLGSFYQRAIRYWFETKGEWSKTVYEALPEIAKRDPEFYCLLETLQGNGSQREKVPAAQEINKLLFGTSSATLSSSGHNQTATPTDRKIDPTHKDITGHSKY